MNTKATYPFEQHPWKSFPKDNGYIRYLILGSFPPRRFTDKNTKLNLSYVNFYYGSLDNMFWDLFCDALNIDINWRCEPERLKDWLIQNHWGLLILFLKRLGQIKRRISCRLGVTKN